MVKHLLQEVDARTGWNVMEISGDLTAYFNNTSLYELYINRRSYEYCMIDVVLSISDKMWEFIHRQDCTGRNWVICRLRELYEKAGLIY
jgi:hypothetical protein